jgi:hypothetical protein
MTALTQPPQPAALLWSERLYKLILALYPRRYRYEYGVHMARTFRDSIRDQYHRHGLLGLIEVWGPTLIDAVFTAITEHLAKGVVLVSKETWSRIGGPALMLGGIAWMIASVGQLQPVNDDAFGGPDIALEIIAFLMIPAILALTVGLVGLRARLGQRAGGVGRAALLFASLSGAVGIIAGVIVSALTSEDGWYLFMAGLLGFYLGVLVFGVSALKSKPFARWNALPVLMAAVVAAMILVSMLGLGPQQISGALGRWIGMGIFGLVGLLWMLLGYNVMAEDRPQPAMA